MSRQSSARFVVVGLHPGIDRTIEVPRLAPAHLIRGRLLMVEATGKGANIAHDLSNFGHRVVATGFLGRPERELYLSSFRRDRVRPAFVVVDSATRENITLIDRSTGKDTHITAGSLAVKRRDISRLLAILRTEVRPGDWAVFSGSCPSGFSSADYFAATRACVERGARLCVDTSGPMLRAVLKLRPWIIKPNRSELEELVGRRLSTLARVRSAASSLLDHCGQVLASLGAEGALLVTKDGAWYARDTRRANVAHTVGCGDALFAGYLSASASGRGPEESLRFAVACGSANVRSLYACLHSREEARRFFPGIGVVSAQ